MSARNYLTSWDKSIDNCLPNINKQKFSYRGHPEFPVYSANHSNSINRNISFNFEVQPYDVNEYDRTSTPFSDLFSESETGTPDIRSEESDSSAGSALCRSTAEAAKVLADEWERIERTIYNEDGDKVTRPQLIEECRQWQQLHPQLRILGKAITLPEKKLCYRQMDHEEIIAMHYSDYEQFSESEERLSQSSNDVTPQNSPRGSICEEPFLNREKITDYYNQLEENTLHDAFCSLLQITPIDIKSPSLRKRKNSSILKSELSSSKWMRNARPDSSINTCDRNSAKSFISLDMRKHSYATSATERNKTLNRLLTAKNRDNARLEPLYTSELIQNDNTKHINVVNQNHIGVRKVSLPPLLLEEERKKGSSAKKQTCSKQKKTKKHHPVSDPNMRKERNSWN